MLVRALRMPADTERFARRHATTLGSGQTTDRRKRRRNGHVIKLAAGAIAGDSARAPVPGAAVNYGA
jgi:hypothetical protein